MFLDKENTIVTPCVPIPPIARCLFTRSRVYRGQERNFHEISFLSRAILTHPQPFPSRPILPFRPSILRIPRGCLREDPRRSPPPTRDPCAWQTRLGEPNDHIHRIQFSLSSRGKMPAGVHDALLTLNADGCEIECQAVELKGDPSTRIREKCWGGREGDGGVESSTRSFGPFNEVFAFPQIASRLESRPTEQSTLREQTTPALHSLPPIFLVVISNRLLPSARCAEGSSFFHGTRKIVLS